jgi:hypothetical protein
LHRPRQHNADDPVACFVTALHTQRRSSEIVLISGAMPE